MVSGQAESGRPQHRITFKNGHEDTPRATPFRQKIKLQIKKTHNNQLIQIFHKTASKDRPKLVGVYSTKGDFAMIFNSYLT